MHRVDRAAVELDRSLRARRGDAADDLRRVLRRPVLTSRVDPLGGEGEIEVLAGLEAGAFEDRQQPLPRRAGVRRRLEDDELAFLQARSDVLDCAEHDREVGLTLCGERRLESDEDGLRLLERVVVRRDLDRARLDEPLEIRGLHVADVALAALDAARSSRGSSSTRSTWLPASAKTCASGSPT